MSFFESASLVFISDFAAASASAVSGSGTDTGKAYNIKPTDGSGDFDFERGSDITATRVNSSGLIEKGRGNFLKQSNQFDTSPWNDGGDYTINPNQNGYDGSTDAWLLNKNTVGNDYLKQTVLSTDSVNTISLYAKEGSVRGVKLVCGGQNVAIDLRDGSTISTGGSSGLTSAGADLVSGTTDWYRVYLARNISTTSILIKPTDENGNDTSGNIYIQDAQLEQGLVATDYIETTTSPLRAGLLEDEPRFDYHNSASATPNTCPSLLLEPGRTNLVRSSEALINGQYGWTLGNSTTLTLNDAISPEGVKNAFRLDIPTAINTTLVRCNVLESTEYTFSFYVKRGTATALNYSIFNFSNLGNIVGTTSYFSQTNTDDFVRIVVPFTTPVGCTDVGVYLDRDSGANGSAWFYGLQLEEGSYATSYIPTYGTAATRGADDADVIDNLSIGNGSEFGVYYEIDVERIPRQSSSPFIQIQFTTANGRIGIKGASDALANYIDLYGTTDFSESFSPLDMGAGIIKFFINYSSGTGDFYLNGTKYAGVISGPTSGCEIDSVYLLGSAYKLKAKQLLIFPEALSDDDCTTLTTL